jgi:hypothetical protein
MSGRGGKAEIKGSRVDLRAHGPLAPFPCKDPTLTRSLIFLSLYFSLPLSLFPSLSIYTLATLAIHSLPCCIDHYSGYDFGYLMRVLTCQKLPEEESDFFDLMSYFFPKVYDVKYLMKSCKNLKGGLQEVADSLKLERVGKQHQAGSDSFLTGAAFFKMKQVFFDDHINEETYCGNVFGLGNSYSGNGYTITDGSQ